MRMSPVRREHDNASLLRFDTHSLHRKICLSALFDIVQVPEDCEIPLHALIVVRIYVQIEPGSLIVGVLLDTKIFELCNLIMYVIEVSGTVAVNVAIYSGSSNIDLSLIRLQLDLIETRYINKSFLLIDTFFVIIHQARTQFSIHMILYGVYHTTSSNMGSTLAISIAQAFATSICSFCVPLALRNSI